MSGPRIVTLTVNPAVDVAADAAEVRPVHKIRTFDERYDPGGGGINVARVVHELGGDTMAMFAAGGVTGHSSKLLRRPAFPQAAFRYMVRRASA
jgi:6-phosphofructokinase 2